MTRRGQQYPREHDQEGQADELHPARDLDARRASDRAHRGDATARVVALRPPDWDWSFGTDGALALKAPEPFATVPDMSPPVKNRRVPASRRRHLERERRLRRLAALIAIALVGARDAAPVRLRRLGRAAARRAPASASRLVPAGPPHPEVIAKLDSLHLQLPVSQSRVTAIGFQGGSANALGVDPLGTQANQGLLRRLARRIFGGASGTRALVSAARRAGPGDLGARRRRRRRAPTSTRPWTAPSSRSRTSC